MDTYSTGILARPPASIYLRLYFFNTGTELEQIEYKVYDWTSGSPQLLYQDSLYLYTFESQIIYLKLVDNSYETLEVNLFEVILTLPSDNSILFSVFTTTSNME